MPKKFNPAPSDVGASPPLFDPASSSGVCFAIAGLIYLIAETVSAAAWRVPAYSYARNYISDLGVTGCGIVFHGRLICSPLHALMNAGFLLEGILFLAATALSSGSIPRPWRLAVLILGTFHCVGMLLVGKFHGSQAALVDGSLRYHLLGAQMAIVAGNLALMLFGCNAARIGLPRKLAVPSVLLGCFGLLSAGMLVSQIGAIPDGLTERGSVYTIMLWEMIAGISILWRARFDKSRNQ